MRRFLILAFFLFGAYCLIRVSGSNTKTPEDRSSSPPLQETAPLGRPALPDQETTPAAAETSVQAPAPEAVDSPPIQIDAPHLLMAYKQNEIAADQRFKEKVLEVRGRVTRIRKDFRDNAVLDLETYNEYETVSARLGEDSVSYAATLAPGAVVTVLCRGAGMIVERPQLKDCSIK